MPRDRSPAAAMRIKEPIRRPAVKRLLADVDKFKFKSEDSKRNAVAVLRNTIAAFDENGELWLTYRHSEEWTVDGVGHGRLYAGVYLDVQGPDGRKAKQFVHAGSQTLPRRLRAALWLDAIKHGACPADTEDTDMIMAFPSILAGLCALEGLPAEDYSHIARYVRSPGEVLGMFAAGITLPPDADSADVRKCAKDALHARLINTGTTAAWARANNIALPLDPAIGGYLGEYKRQCEASILEIVRKKRLDPVVRAICRKREDKDGKHYDYYKTAAHMLLGDAECALLLAACTGEAGGMTAMSLQFDGAPCASPDLEAMRKRGRDATGLDVKWAVKPWETDIVIPDVIEVRDKKQMADAVYITDPEAFADLKYDPEESYFLYKDGHWNAVPEDCAMKLFIRIADECPSFDAKDREKFWNGYTAVFKILVAERCLEPGFRSKLDTSLDIFPFRNGCWDLAKNEFRPLTREDYVQLHSGWDYAPSSEASREVVARFFTGVYPVEEEREFVRSVVKYILSLRRHIPFVFVLTDTENGRNGKSSVKAVLCKLLGSDSSSSLVLDNKTLFLADPKPGRNSHSGNEAHLEGKILLVGDEFASNQSLAADWIKEKSGGTGARCNGRHVSSKKGFSFSMRALMVVVWNEHSMPNFGSDSVLPTRCVFIKHRTKFLEPEEFEALKGNYEYPAPMQKGADEMIAQNLSAVFDYAMGGDVESVRFPPKYFTKFRDDMISEDNPLMPWFAANFAVTNKAEDNTLQVNRVKEYIERYGADQRIKHLKHRQVTAFFERCLHHHKLKMIQSDGERRRVIVGLRPKTDLELSADAAAD